MTPLTRSLKRSIKSIEGKKRLPDWVEEIQDFFDQIPGIPRKIKYWYLENYTKQKLVMPELHGGFIEHDYVLLHAMFQVLVNYVEGDLAWTANVSDPESPFHHLKGAPEREIAMAVLAHQTDTDEDSPMAQTLKDNDIRDLKILKLYRWWTEERPKRVDGISPCMTPELLEFEPWEHMPADDRGMSLARPKVEDPLYQVWRNACDESTKLDELYEKEDTKMMKLLIDVRSGLWT